MRILQLINALTTGGAQFVVLDLARHARADGHEVQIACFRDGPIGDTLRAEGFTVHVLGESCLDLPAFAGLIALLRKFRPEVVHSHLFRASFWARMLRLFSSQCRLVTSVHGSETGTFHCLEKLMSRFSDHMIFPSRFLRDWYDKNIRHLQKSECSVIYPGVNIGPASQNQAPSQPIKIGTLSRLHPVKGIDRLIEACAALKERGIAFVLFIGGAGKHLNELQNQAEKLQIAEQCRFVGPIANQRAFLDNIDIFVAPSRQEAFGIHICEAMERGLPIVGARVGGIPELVEHEQTGLLFNPDCKNDLADSLARLTADPEFCQRAGRLGRLRVESSFNRQTGIKKHLEIFARLQTVCRRVHFVISSEEMGGGERLALGLMQSLQQRGWQVSALCSGAPLSEAIRKLGIKCSVAPMTAGGAFFMSRLLGDCHRFKPQVISSHLNRASMLAGIIGKFSGIPVVSHVHGLNKKSYYQFSSRLIAVSKAVSDHLIGQGCPSANLEVIRNCIAGPAEGCRKAVSGSLNVAIVAKLHANKGHRWALEVISRQPDLCGIGKIHIVGDGPERENLEKLCSNGPLRQIVVFHGFVNEPDLIYPQIDVALLPSLGEGIPLSLLEAMRFGIPCIATEIGGIPEVITHQVNGLLIRPKDEVALVAAFRQMSIASDYERFSRGAIGCFKSVNNYQAMVDGFERVLLREITQKQ